MTKISLILVMAIISTSLHAQIKKNSISVGGQLSFSSTTQVSNFPQETEYRSNSFGLAIGKAIKDNVVVGITAGYSGSKIIDNPPGNYTAETDNFTGGFFYRRYKPLAKDLYFFGQGEIGFLTGKQEYINGSANYITTGRNTGGYLSLMPGLSYKVLRILHLELTLPNLVRLDYTSNKQLNSNTPALEVKNNNFSFNSNLNGSILSSVGIGFRLIF